MVELASKHEPEEIAKSLYRCSGKAACGDEPPGFDSLGVEEQLFWLNLAKKGPDVLETSEGMPLAAVAARLYGLAHDPAGFQGLPGRVRLVWEMLTRHLLAVVDCDEVGSLGEVEEMVLGWFNNKAALAA